MNNKVSRALLSVSDKTGLEGFARQLAQQGVELLSTGGTYKALAAAGIPVREVSEYTGFPEMMHGRVKTLHPKVHGGILALRDEPTHVTAMKEHGISDIDLVVINLYPFEATVAKPGVSRADAIEQIDIGGPSMVRSAAKNHRFVGIVTDPADYGRVLDELQRNEGALGSALRRELALKAFQTTSRYDAAIAAWLFEQEVKDGHAQDPYPEVAALVGRKVMSLRYGENPHQTAAFYTQSGVREPSIATAEIQNGKQLSYNNLVDLDSALALARSLGFEASPHVLGIVLPVGISFYTFQTMSYSLDVYRRELRAVRDPVDFALFVTFFPQLVAGPIVRAIDFLPQLERKRLWSDVRVRACLTLFLVGYVKKACVGDNVSSLVDPYFENPAQFDALSAWSAVLFYAVQIYCDFSGYSDMAIATAGLFGYELRTNFEFPYLATSIRDFWRRWHMSLSSWLRDYLYIPLGGNRGSRLFQHRNLLLTMLLGGLWHGAGWNFVIWGALHGGALVAHREWERAGLRMPALLGLLATFWWTCLAWIFFRAPTFDGALVTVRSFVLLDSPGTRSTGWVPLATFGCLALLHWACSKRWLERESERIPQWSYAVALGILVPLALAFTNAAVKPFIYFQF